MSETFGQLLAKFRERKGWSREVLAMEANLSGASMIWRFEHGKRRPSRNTVMTIAIALDANYADLAALLVAAGYWPGERGAVLVLDGLAAARAAGIGSKWG